MATSWSLTTSKDLSAELRLAQAISEFQSLLSPKEKIEFQAQNLQLSKEAPGARDVYRLTAEIDRASKLVSGGRVYGPRFTNFLQAVQRFASLGDILVGGSQNLIACGVWTGVRFALMATTARASFVSKVSEIFMSIGQSAPRFEELAHLYSGSKLLQVHLLEYFVVVVHLCHYVLQCSKQTGIGQFVSSLSDSKLNAFQTQLSSRAQFVKDEIIALTMSLVKDESTKSDKFRAWYLGDSKAAKHRRKMKLRAKLLDRCSSYEYEASWKQLRKAGTARFFSDLPEYQQWKSSTTSRTLLWAGKIGSGKSVLLASIIDDLNLDKTLSSHTLVAYFFCQWDIAESLKVRTILGSLARQILSAYYLERGEEFRWNDLLDEGIQISSDDIVLTITQAMPKGDRLVFVLDGIDECDQLEYRELLVRLSFLQSVIHLDICTSVSAAPEYPNSTRQGLRQLRSAQTLEIPEHNPDIAAFIENALSQRILDKQLAIGDHALREEIQNALLKGAQGMMLWVALQIDAICLEKTDSDIRRSLENLPKTLSEAFQRELHRCSQHNIKYRDRMMCILLGAARPLTLDEFGEATSVEVENTTWDAAKRINDVRSLLQCCGKLVTVDEESTAVRLVHHSIRQYLMSDYLASDGAVMSEFRVQKTWINILVTYLNYDIFERQITIRTADLPAKYITTNVLTRAMKSSTAAELTMRLIQRNNKTSDFDIVKALTKLKTDATANDQQIFAFKIYAEEFYLDHAWPLIATPYSPMIPLFLNVVRKLAAPLLSFAEESMNNPKNFNSSISASWTSLRGHITLIALLEGRQHERTLWLLRDTNDDNCLDWATGQRSPELLTSFARLCFQRVHPDNHEAAKAFRAVLQRGYFDTATHLWENFALTKTIYSYALVSLIQSGNIPSVKWLLQRGPGVIASFNPFKNPLLFASFNSRVNGLSREREYPMLFFAIDEESAPMTRLLLEHGASESHVRGYMWPSTADNDRVQHFLVTNGFKSLSEQIKENPFSAQPGQYRLRARAITDYTSTGEHPEEMGVSQNDILMLNDINDRPTYAGREWLLVENSRKAWGLVPLDCLLLLTRPSTLPDPRMEVALVKGFYNYRAKAICSYNGNPNDMKELSLVKGDILDVVSLDETWWRGRNSQGWEGIVPKIYLEFLEAIEVKKLSITPFEDVASTNNALPKSDISPFLKNQAAEVKWFQKQKNKQFKATATEEQRLGLVRGSDTRGRYEIGEGWVDYGEEEERHDAKAHDEEGEEEEEEHDDHDQEEDKDNTCEAYALHAYTARQNDPNELSFKGGERLKILDLKDQTFKYNQFWWTARNRDGQTGLVPTTYLIPEKRGKIESKQRQSAFENDIRWTRWSR